MKKVTTFIFLLLSLLLVSCLGNDGVDGLNSLLLTSLEPAGTNCPTGGLKVDSGLDSNANGVLDTDEILTTNYICSGVNSLINVFDELAGGTCQNGGIRIESGLDSNGNGTLEEEEIQVTRFLCNADGGGFDEQIRIPFDFGGAPGAGTFSTQGILIGDIPNFNKNFWVGVDSIVFVTKFGRDVAISTSFVEVFDKTNNDVIPNTLMMSDELLTETTPFFYSDNFLSDLPEDEIDLSILLRTDNNNGGAVLVRAPAYLFLYRSN